jgi:hypothetical protein
VTKYIHFLSPKIKWAIAGRNHGKLAAIKSELMEMKVTSSEEYSFPDILIGDVTDIRGMKDMFSTCKLVLNCTGPYRFLGFDIVEACISAKADYMDISGEPVFMEQSFLKFHETAASQGILILHSCGFDSVPADLGCLFTMQQYPPQMCSSIESYMIIRCPAGLAAHYTAFESAIHDAGDVSLLKQLRKDIVERFQPPQLMEIGPKLKKRPAYYYDKRVKKYTLPFLGADVNVVKSSQRTLAMLEGQIFWPQYQAYVAISSVYNLAATSFYGSLCNSLAGSSLGRSMLLSFPEIMSGGVFTHAGPSAKQLEKTTFEIHLYGKGYSTYMTELTGDALGHSMQSSSNTSNEKEKEVLHDEKEKESYAREPSTSLAADVQQTAVINKSCTSSFLDYSFKSSSSLPPPPPPTDREVHIVVSGPEPGYVATPMIFVTLALCVLEERESMPVGGVFTPAAAFHKSLTVIDRLDRAGIAFTIHETSMQGDSDQFLDELVVANVDVDGDGRDDAVSERKMEAEIDRQPAASEQQHELDGYEHLKPEATAVIASTMLDINVAITEDAEDENGIDDTSAPQHDATDTVETLPSAEAPADHIEANHTDIIPDVVDLISNSYR